MTSLADIAYNQSASTVLILDNSITGMTGHQQNPTTGLNIKGDPAGKIDLEALCKAMGIGRVRVVDPYNLAQCEQALKEELAADEPSVIIVRRPCVLLKQVKTASPLTVDPAKCVGCKACMKLGCPSISIRAGKAHIGRDPLRRLRGLQGTLPDGRVHRQNDDGLRGRENGNEKHHDRRRRRPRGRCSPARCWGGCSSRKGTTSRFRKSTG